jgi:hypothetical protein
MANSSILGGERPPVQPKGKDTGALGPSDSSDISGGRHRRVGRRRGRAAAADRPHARQQSGMAFVVILHLSPTHEEPAAEILQRVTRMPVTQVQTG